MADNPNAFRPWSAEDELLQQQLAQAYALRSARAPRRSTVAGTAFSGLANVLDGVRGGMRAKELEGQRASLLSDMSTDARTQAEALSAALRGGQEASGLSPADALAQRADAAQGAALSAGMSTNPLLKGTADAAQQSAGNLFRQALAARNDERRGKTPGDIELERKLKEAELKRREAETSAHLRSEPLRNRLVQAQIADFERRPDKEAAERELREELARLRLEAEQGREAKKEKKDIEKQVQDLADRISDAGPLLRDIATLKPYLAADDIPGVGRIASRLPAEALSAEGADVQGRVYGIVSRLLKLQSGAGVSEGEVKRKMLELGMGPGMPEESFRLGLSRLDAEYQTAMQEALQRHSPEVVDEYLRRGNALPKGVQYRRPTTAPAPRQGGSPEAPARPAPAPSPAAPAAKQQATPPREDGAVRMESPKGQRGWVPAGQVQQAEANGWKRI